MAVSVFLLDDGVYLAKSDQTPPPGQEALNAEVHIKKLLEMGIEFIACGVCLNARGIADDELLPAVSVAGLADLARKIKNSKHALTF